MRAFSKSNPQKRWLIKDFLLRFPLKQQRALELSSPLKLVTEKQIRINPILGNLKLLHRYSGFQSFTPLHIQLLKLVEDLGHVSLSTVSGTMSAPPEEVFASALSLLASGLIDSDLTSREIDLSSVVWVR